MNSINILRTSEVRKLNAASAASLAEAATALIQSIRKADETYGKIAKDAEALGLDVPKEGTDLEYLQAIAKAALTKAHELALLEDIKRMSEKSTAEPVRGLGGLLRRGAAALERRGL